jgi:hypothetical protein
MGEITEGDDQTGALTAGSFVREDCDFCLKPQYDNDVCLACGHNPGCTICGCCHNYLKLSLDLLEHDTNCDRCFGCGCDNLEPGELCEQCNHGAQCVEKDPHCLGGLHCRCQLSDDDSRCEDCGHTQTCPDLDYEVCESAIHCQCAGTIGTLCGECGHDSYCPEAEYFCEQESHVEEPTDFVISWN